MKIGWFVICFVSLVSVVRAETEGDTYSKQIKPFLEKYCVDCHGGKEINGHVNFLSIGSMSQAYKKHELWEKVLEMMQEKNMPPEDEKQPSEEEKKILADWYQEKFVNIKPRPANARLRRLSIAEYRNALRSLIGFDLSASVSETPETVQENSLVVKLLPPDPPGESGFSNDTAQSPMTTTHWEKYNFLTDTAVENLFSTKHQSQLESYTGPIEETLKFAQVEKLITKFTRRAFKSSECDEVIANILSRIETDHKNGISYRDATKKELKSILLSPQFLFNGHYDHDRKGEQAVSGSELAQRLSFFLWGTVPDDQLLLLAANGELANEKVLAEQVDRMLNDERSKMFTETLAREWFDLDEIKKTRNNPPRVHALLIFFPYTSLQKPCIIFNSIKHTHHFAAGFRITKWTSKELVKNNLWITLTRNESTLLVVRYITAIRLSSKDSFCG